MGPIFVYLMTYGGSLASIFNPFLGLLIYISFSIIKPEFMWYWSVEPGSYSRIIALCLIVSWAIRGFGNWSFGKGWPIVLALLGFWIWMVLASSQAPDQARAWAYVEEKSKVFLPFLIGMTLIDTSKKLTQLVWTIFLSQAYVAWEMNLAYYSGFNRLHVIGFGGMDNNCVAIAMVTCVGVGFFVFLREKNTSVRILALAFLALLIHSVLFSNSRGGMVALIVTGITVFMLLPKRPVYIVGIILTVLLTLQAAGPSVRERFMSTFDAEESRDRSAQNRLDYWGYCLETIPQKPIFGVGPDYWSEYVAQNYGRTRAEAHNLWLQLTVELGIPAIALLVSFYGLTIWRLLVLRRDGGADAFVCDMVIAGITGFAVSSQFVSLIGLELPYYVVLIGAGLLKIHPEPFDLNERCDL